MTYKFESPSNKMTKACTEKVQLADEYVRALGFTGLDDRLSVIGKPELTAALSDIDRFHDLLIKHFRKSITKRLRSRVDDPYDVIALLRCVLRDRDIDMGISTRKYNRRVNGRQTAIFQYRLLGR